MVDRVVSSQPDNRMSELVDEEPKKAVNDEEEFEYYYEYY